MIYFDNAATTYPKPMAVTNAVRTALQKYGANPGRSGHKNVNGCGRRGIPLPGRRGESISCGRPGKCGVYLKLHPRYQYSIEGAF